MGTLCLSFICKKAPFSFSKASPKEREPIQIAGDLGMTYFEHIQVGPTLMNTPYPNSHKIRMNPGSFFHYLLWVKNVPPDFNSGNLNSPLT